MTGQPTVAAVVARSCVSCGAELSGDYCSACGQKVIPPLTLRALLARIAHAVDLDGSVIATARGLLLRPGIVIGDWLRGRTGGRWRHHLGALATVLLAAVALVYVMTVGLVGVFSAAAALLD